MTETLITVKGAASLQAAMNKLNAAAIPYQHPVALGFPAEVIVDYRTKIKRDQIVMGSRRLGRLSGFLLGAVASELAH